MERYTIEDIELIRKKSGISYQEAVALLDYHNGNVARALVDLERNGRIKPEGASAGTKESKPAGHHHSASGFGRFMTRLYQARLKVKRGETPILNVSALFGIIGVLISPHLAILALILCLCLGYRISFEKRDPDFASDDLESMVKSAAQNVKDSVSSIARDFSAEDAAKQSKQEAGKAAESKPEEATHSYYTANPAATTAPRDYTGRAPVLQVPVQVESQDGSVEIQEDKDGYGSATIQ